MAFVESSTKLKVSCMVSLSGLKGTLLVISVYSGVSNYLYSWGISEV